MLKVSTRIFAAGVMAAVLAGVNLNAQAAEAPQAPVQTVVAR